MTNRIVFILLLNFLLLSCIPEENLPLRNVGATPEYFIECYCKPGQSFSLSATPILPVSENLEIDFSARMQVIIHTYKDIELQHTVFTLPGSDFIYNYGTRERLEMNGPDSLYLFITTDKGKKIQSVTAIPSSLEVYEHTFQNNTATIRFYTSSNFSENYYIYTAEMLRSDSIFHKETCYLNYSDYPLHALVEKEIILTEAWNAEKIILNLKRITQANYDYQISLNAANSANQSSITTPVPIKGNLQGALGIFTCYTEYQTEITNAGILPPTSNH